MYSYFYLIIQEHIFKHRRLINPAPALALLWFWFSMILHSVFCSIQKKTQEPSKKRESIFIPGHGILSTPIYTQNRYPTLDDTPVYSRLKIWGVIFTCHSHWVGCFIWSISVRLNLRISKFVGENTISRQKNNHRPYRPSLHRPTWYLKRSQDVYHLG